MDWTTGSVVGNRLPSLGDERYGLVIPRMGSDLN